MSETSKKWRCPYCDGLNDWQNTVCEICGDGRRNDVAPAEKAERVVEIPRIYTPQKHGPEESGPVLTPTPESRYTPPSASAESHTYASEAARQSGHAGFWFGAFAIGFAALTCFDGLLAWFLICSRLGLAGTSLCPHNDASSYGYLCAIFLGLIPMAALWLRAKGAKFLSFLFATAGLACAAAAVYAMLSIHMTYALGWLLYALAALLAWIYAVTGRHGRGIGGFCVILGLASLALTVWLTLCTDWMRASGGHFASLNSPRSFRYVGTTWWRLEEWASFIFGSHKQLSGGQGPASAWLPFSRALAILAMSFGFRLPARDE